MLIKIIQETKNFFPNYVQVCFEQARKEFLNEETKTRRTQPITIESKSYKQIHNRKTDMVVKKILRNDIPLQSKHDEGTHSRRSSRERIEG